jgi:hypothetical protein
VLSNTAYHFVILDMQLPDRTAMSMYIRQLTPLRMASKAARQQVTSILKRDALSEAAAGCFQAQCVAQRTHAVDGAATQSRPLL